MNNFPSTPGAERVEILDDGRLRVSADFLPLLRAGGLDSFEKIMALPEQAVVRSFPGRNTIRLELKRTDGGSAAFFLKRYERAYLSPLRRALRWLRWPGAEDEALREWNSLQLLRVNGFPTPTPVAVGQEISAGVVTRSFVMTEEIIAGVCAHDCVPGLTVAQRRAFVRELGELTRRFHTAGFVHKDFYLYHVFVILQAEAGLRLVLIDLQRVVQPDCFRERWLVKDLAALAYSALVIRMPQTDLLRFFKIYRGRNRLNDGDRQLARKVLRRVAWLDQRQPKHDRPLPRLPK